MKNENTRKEVAKGIVDVIVFVSFSVLLCSYTDGFAEGFGINIWWSVIIDLPAIFFAYGFFIGDD